MKHLSLLLALSLLMLGLGACGQSGPLYLPPPPSNTPTQLQSTPQAVPPTAPGPDLNQTSNNPNSNITFVDNSGDDGLGNEDDTSSN